MITIDEFFEKNKDTVFRFCVYRKPGLWTPLEMDKKYSDESIFEDCHYQFARVTNVVKLEFDYLLELDIVDDETFDSYGHKEYCKLSEIRLSCFEDYNKGE